MPSINLSPINIPPPTILREIRTSRLRQFGPVISGIDKTLRDDELQVSKLGLPDDEHDLTFHGGIDKAIHQYCSEHYAFWQSLYPDDSIKSRFVPGGFGENLVASGFDETNICIGDLIRVGPPGSSSTDSHAGCVLEVSLPRQPCFKLNQRFTIKNLAPQTHQHAKTGWYYRVREEGVIKAGMEMRIVKRDHPRWSIARLHHYVHRDRDDMEVAHELMEISVMGDECRNVFENRWQKHSDKSKVDKRGGGKEFRVVIKAMETPRIARLELQAVEPPDTTTKIPSGSYAVIKLPNGLRRAYSIVSGSTDLFVLGVARDDNSRGGSTYMHDQLETGSIVNVVNIEQSVSSNGMASHYIFIVGGIGITAFMILMNRVISINCSLELHYAVRTAEDTAFLSLISALGPNVNIYDRSKGERMDIENILRNRLWNSQVYTCGPQRMIDNVIEAAAVSGMTEGEVHYEIFGADSSGDPFSAEVIQNDAKVNLQIGANNTLLETLRAAGLEVGSSCETGNCGTCRILVKCGKIDHRGTGLTKEEQKKEMLSCVSRGIGHITIELPEP